MFELGSKVTSDQQLPIYTMQPVDVVTRGAATVLLDVIHFCPGEHVRY